MTKKLKVGSLQDSPHAPLVMVDTIPTFGVNHGLINLTLAANRYLPGEDGVVVSPTVTAHLRFTREVAIAMRDTLDKVLLMSTPSRGIAN